MSYLGLVEPSLTTIIEISKSTSQTASAGDVVTFDTLRATSTGHGVSINSTTGEISLTSGREYQVTASLDVNRSASNDSFRFAWIDSSGTEITVNNGGYDANFKSSSVESSTLTAVYQPSTLTSPIRLKAFNLGSSSTINVSTSVTIIEVKA